LTWNNIWLSAKKRHSFNRCKMACLQMKRVLNTGIKKRMRNIEKN
jgi:hypothetical protein